MTPDDDTGADETGPAPTAYPGTSPQPASTSRRPIADVTARVETIVTAAEEVARDIRADAEAEALVYSREKHEEVDRTVAARHQQLAELRDSLTGQAEMVQREVRVLASQIEDLMSQAGRLRSAQAVESPSARPGSTSADSETPSVGTPTPSPEDAAADIIAEAESASSFPSPASETTPGASRGGPLEPSSYPPPESAAGDDPESPAVEDEPAEVEEDPKPRFSFRRPKSSAASESDETSAVSDPASDPPDGDLAGDSDASAKADTEAESPVADAPEAPRRDPDAAMLMATQMAVAGSSRSDVRTALLAEFEPEDAERAILEVLGPEGLG